MDMSVLDTVANISNCLAGVFLLSGMFKKKDNSAKALLALWTAVLLKRKEERESAELNAALAKAKECVPELTEALENPAITPVTELNNQIKMPKAKTPVIKNEIDFTPALMMKHQQGRCVA